MCLNRQKTKKSCFFWNKLVWNQLVILSLTRLCILIWFFSVSSFEIKNKVQSSPCSIYILLPMMIRGKLVHFTPFKIKLPFLIYIEHLLGVGWMDGQTVHIPLPRKVSWFKQISSEGQQQETLWAQYQNCKKRSLSLKDSFSHFDTGVSLDTIHNTEYFHRLSRYYIALFVVYINYLFKSGTSQQHFFPIIWSPSYNFLILDEFVDVVLGPLVWVGNLEHKGDA